MEWMYLFYFLLGGTLFFGARCCRRGEWNADSTSLRQTKMLQGFAALCIALHHMAQKTCAPWHPGTYIVHGLDFFVPVGFLFVGIFLFGSGLGLYKSWKSKPDYLKGFVRRRILPIVIAFYLSEWIWLGVRLLMGEKMKTGQIFWYLSGLVMANPNSWYVIVIPFFYLAFYLAFRFCRREGTAIAAVTIFTLLYTFLGASIDHQNIWWMRGEWWYNSIILFPLGLIFGKYERQITAFFRKGYWIHLILAFAAMLTFYFLSVQAADRWWGYYGENWRDPLKVPHRLGTCAMQWLACVGCVHFCNLLMMKVRLGNKLLGILGTCTLSFYLMHGIFVDMFGYNFLDKVRSVYYIRNVPLYILTVLSASAAATFLFHMLWRFLVRLVCMGRPKGPFPHETEGNASDKGQDSPSPKQHMKLQAILRKIPVKRLIPALLLGALVLGAVLPLSGQNPSSRKINGITLEIPTGFVCSYSDSSTAVWKYQGNDKKPGPLILNTNIVGSNIQGFLTAEEVIDSNQWLREAEIYVNPAGIRMARGYSLDYAKGPEYRYYVETKKNVILLSMNEDERYYSPQDCHEMLQTVADGIRFS